VLGVDQARAADLVGADPEEEGLEAARRAGRTPGRRPKMTPSKIRSARTLLADGTPPREVAKNLGVSIPTLYRWLPATDR